ncbi:MAG: putative transglutaminase-like cysteine proteinase [Sulfurimonas sp.]|uniref:transglutaminase-like cysteine peptidase n=1 Tax=Sulfurimonas sp. TaxID=2022749 RepID=UPI0039E5BA17
MQYLSLFLLVVLLFTGCSQHKVEIEKVAKPVVVEKPIKGIISEAVIQKAQRKYGKNARTRYEMYNAKIRKLQNSTTEVKLEEINNFFNKIPYFTDMKVWGKKDYWATPLEFLAKAKGDCEDYVIAKYFSLRNLGVAYEKLYFSYVKSTHYTRPHMVLSYFETPHSIPLVLDSINYKIFPANKRKDLIPIYNYNGESLYRVKNEGRNGPKVKNRKKVDDKWQKLLDDIQMNKL